MEIINGKKLGGFDDLCYRLDNEAAPFVMTLIWTFEEDKVNISSVKSEFESLIKKFPRYSCVIADDNSFTRYRWKYIPNFNVDDNIEVHALSTGTLNEFQVYASECASSRLDKTKSLWRAYIVYGLDYEDERDGNVKKQRSALIGPMKPIIFTGQKVERFIAVPPQPGPGGLGIGILSYDGKVSISILSNEMPKYPNISKRISQLFINEWEKILHDAKLELKKENNSIDPKKNDLNSMKKYWHWLSLSIGFLSLILLFIDKQ
ncbi:16939_t:CDS:2 [Entrophospora sp. SA101]|nr:16939_t:CDS:2 [Entrophospora sp. SA101]